MEKYAELCQRYSRGDREARLESSSPHAHIAPSTHSPSCMTYNDHNDADISSYMPHGKDNAPPYCDYTPHTQSLDYDLDESSDRDDWIWVAPPHLTRSRHGEVQGEDRMSTHETHQAMRSRNATTPTRQHGAPETAEVTKSSFRPHDEERLETLAAFYTDPSLRNGNTSYAHSQSPRPHTSPAVAVQPNPRAVAHGRGPHTTQTRRVDDPLPLESSPWRGQIACHTHNELEADATSRARQRQAAASASTPTTDVDALMRRGRGACAPSLHYNSLASLTSSHLTLGSFNTNIPNARALHVYRDGVREVCGVDPASLRDTRHYRHRMVWAPARLEPSLFGTVSPHDASSRCVPARSGAQASTEPRAAWNTSARLSSHESRTAACEASGVELHRTSSPHRGRGAARDADLYDPVTGVSLKATELPARYFKRWSPYGAARHTVMDPRGRASDREEPVRDVSGVVRLVCGEGEMNTHGHTPRRRERAFKDGPSSRIRYTAVAGEREDGDTVLSSNTITSPDTASFSSSERGQVACNEQQQHPHRRFVSTGAHHQHRASRREGLEATLHHTLGHDTALRPTSIVPSQWRRDAHALRAQQNKTEAPSVHSTRHAQPDASRTVVCDGEQGPPPPRKTIKNSSSYTDRARPCDERLKHVCDGLVNSHVDTYPASPSERSCRQASTLFAENTALDLRGAGADEATHAVAHRRVFPFPPLMTPLLLEVDECLRAHELGSVLDIWRASRSAQDQLLQAVGLSRKSERETILWELARMVRNTSSTCL